MAIWQDDKGSMFLEAECPVCEHYGPHPRSDVGGKLMFMCSLCNTSFHTGEQPGLSTWLPDSGVGD